MPNVLLLCEYPTLGGGEHSMLSTLDGLRAAGFTPAAMAPPAGPLAGALRARDVEVVPLVSHDAAGNRLPQTNLRQQLARALQCRRVDLLHANSLSMGRLSGPVAKDLGLPSLAHLRDIIKLSRQATADLNCHRRLLAVSRATRDFHTAAGLDARKTHVLYNGVDLQRFRPRTPAGALHRELGLPPRTPLIGTIGQICLRKGQDVLVRAAASVAEEFPHVHFLLIGERYSRKAESRRFEDELQAATAGRLAGRLQLLGFRHDIPELLGELTLLVHAARQEPLGRVLLEAAAAGVAVIATDVGGTREIFPPQSRSARLVAPHDPQALATAIRELLPNASLRSRLATSARHRAEEAFDVRCAVRELLEHYWHVLRSPWGSADA